MKDHLDINVHQLSDYLFWDIEKNKIDFTKNKKWLIQRVLEYGLLNDWKIIYKHYGIDEIAKMAITMKDIDVKTVSFIALLSNIPKEKFLCYTGKKQKV